MEKLWKKLPKNNPLKLRISFGSMGLLLGILPSNFYLFLQSVKISDDPFCSRYGLSSGDVIIINI